jgi:hypothetical protein
VEVCSVCANSGVGMFSASLGRGMHNVALCRAGELRLSRPNRGACLSGTRGSGIVGETV